MLAGKRTLLSPHGIEIERTPLLVPSFSSKGFPEVANMIETAEDFIEGPTLVSAYDLHHKHIAGPFTAPSLIFLDSGGYEAGKDTDLSDLGEHDHVPRQWTREDHLKVLSSWDFAVPTVVISYDHPRDRTPTKEQISRALDLPVEGKAVRELLLKPETKGQRFLKLANIYPYVHDLAKFDIIGVTEKEIGSSILERMQNIASLRLALKKAGLEKPIHVFGSLDTLTTPLYFVAGADVFDGLTWLRFGFKDGQTLYRQNYGAMCLSIDTKAHMVDARCWYNNYYYLKELQLDMRRFLKEHDFSSFRYHADLIKTSYQTIAEELEI